MNGYWNTVLDRFTTCHWHCRETDSSLRHDCLELPLDLFVNKNRSRTYAKLSGLSRRRRRWKHRRAPKCKWWGRTRRLRQLFIHSSSLGFPEERNRGSCSRSPPTHTGRRVSRGQENIQTQTTSGDVMVEAESLTVHVNKSVFGHLGDGHCAANLWPSHSELIAVAATQNNNNNIYLGQRPKQEEITRGKQAGIQPTTTLMGNKKERTRFLLKRSNTHGYKRSIMLF